MHHALPIISSKFCKLEIIWWTLHFNMQCTALSTVNNIMHVFHKMSIMFNL
jgi:hypothetical protein